jgi:acyl carrier protein phosphodiesterase
MNFLAHLALSAGDEEEMLGNLLGDFTRIVDVTSLPEGMKRGIRLHRAIDRFTDFHPIFSVSKERVSDERWRFSGVLVDVFYDHFLARDFVRYTGRELPDFLRDVYAALQKRKGHLSEKFALIVDRMIEQNWLGCYVTLEGIDLTLVRVARRLSRPTNIGSGVAELRADYDGFDNDFAAFWPEVQKHVQAERRRELAATAAASGK